MRWLLKGWWFPWLPAAIIAIAALVAADWKPQAQVGGWAHPIRLNGLSTTVTPIIGRGGSLGMLHCNNSNASNTAYIQLFDAATNTAVTLGTTSPVLSVAIPQSHASGYALAVSGIGF